MRPVHAVLASLPLLAPLPDEACPGPPADLWSMTERADLVVEARGPVALPSAVPGDLASVEVLRVLKGTAGARIEVSLDREQAQDCLTRGGHALLLWLVSGDRLVEEAESRLGPAPDGQEEARWLTQLRARASGRMVALWADPDLTCVDASSLPAVGRAVERAAELQRGSADPDARREFLLELAEDPLTRRLGVRALADGRRWGPETTLDWESQVRLASAFTRTPAVDFATPELLELLEGYQDPLLDAALLESLQDALAPQEVDPQRLLAAAGVIDALLAKDQDLAEAPDQLVSEILSAEELRAAVERLRERGPRAVRARQGAEK